jgi:hypothetical protein
MLTQRACARVARRDSSIAINSSIAIAARKAEHAPARTLPDSLLANGELPPAASAAVGSAQI